MMVFHITGKKETPDDDDDDDDDDEGRGSSIVTDRKSTISSEVSYH